MKVIDNMSKFAQRKKLPPKTAPTKLPDIKPEDLVDIPCKAMLVDAEGKDAGVCGGLLFDKTWLLKEVPSILAAGRPNVVSAQVFSCRRCGTVLRDVLIDGNKIFKQVGR